MSLDRRRFLGCGAGLLAAGVASPVVAHGMRIGNELQALPLLAPDPPPRVHRFRLGDMTIAIVNDGRFTLPAEVLAPEEEEVGTTGAGAQEASRGEGEEVVQQARSHIGTPYVHSPPGSCEAHHSEDCSCLTSVVFARFGITLPDDPIGQWDYGRHVAKSNLRPGDLLFFKERGASHPITHVGIYSGNGNIIHASSYWGAVVERPLNYVSGYYGARRLG
jgi:cell wall-associated NlpC family hydrolase